VDQMRSPDFEVEGTTGPITFASNGDNEYKNLTLYVVREGAFQLLR